MVLVNKKNKANKRRKLSNGGIEKEESDARLRNEDAPIEEADEDCGLVVDEDDLNPQEDSAPLLASADNDPGPTAEPVVSDGRYRNKQRCLVLCSRGVTARYRHLLEDLRTLVPHHKKESKLDPGKHTGMGHAVNDICELRGCNTVLFLECRKRQDAYMWMGRSKVGPSVKFHVSNLHTMDELRLTGNCMKHSRPILSFDESFGRLDHLKILKELFVEVFGTPRGHPKSKPFVDRVMCFFYADNRIWVRNYQILEQQASDALEAHQTKKQTGQADSTSLVEIGPRFVLNPIRIFRGSFGGQCVYQNEHYVSPNEVRAAERKDKGQSYEERKQSQQLRKKRLASEQLQVPKDPLDSVFR